MARTRSLPSRPCSTLDFWFQNVTEFSTVNIASSSCISFPVNRYESSHFFPWERKWLFLCIIPSTVSFRFGWKSRFFKAKLMKRKEPSQYIMLMREKLFSRLFYIEVINPHLTIWNQNTARIIRQLYLAGVLFSTYTIQTIFLKQKRIEKRIQIICRRYFLYYNFFVEQEG